MTSTAIPQNAEREIEVASARIATLKSDHDLAAAEHQATCAARDEVLQRVNQMQVEKAAVVADRRAGKLAACPGPRLATLDVDIGLAQEILGEREAVVARTTKVLADSQLAIAQAEEHLKRVSDRVEHDTVIARIRHIETVFLAALQRQEALHKAIGGGSRPAWAPLTELADRVKKADLMRLDRARGGQRFA